MRDVTDSTAPFFFKIPYPRGKQKHIGSLLNTICSERQFSTSATRDGARRASPGVLCQTPVPRFPAKRFSSTQSMKKILGFTLWLFNIAMENGKYIGDENPDLPSKNCDFP